MTRPSTISGATSAPVRQLGALDVLVLSAWCGLAAGWLEVGTRVLLKSLVVTDRMYLMSRQFVWLVPLSNLLLFLVAGLFLAVATKLLAPTGRVAQPATDLCGRPHAGAHGGGAANLPVGLVDPGVGNRDASGRRGSKGRRSGGVGGRS